MKTGKFYYCPKCKCYPDKIYEHYKNYADAKTWNKKDDCYEFDDDDMYEKFSHASCGNCGTKLIQTVKGPAKDEEEEGDEDDDGESSEEKDAEMMRNYESSIENEDVKCEDYPYGDFALEFYDQFIDDQLLNS